MNFYKKLGEIRPNQLITTYGPGSIMDAVNDSLTVLDIEYWDNNNIGKEIRDARLASYMNVRKFYMPKTGGKEDIPVISFPIKFGLNKASGHLKRSYSKLISSPSGILYFVSKDPP